MQQNTAPSVQLGGSKVASIIACNTIMLALASFGACVRVTAQVFVRRFDPDDGEGGNDEMFLDSIGLADIF